MTDISIVLGTYNRLELLKKCVESVKNDVKRDWKLYITDAGSTDGTIEYLKSIASDRIIPIFVGEKIGQARAYNDVFFAVDSPYVCWISDDNELVNGGLDTAVGILEDFPRIGMVGLKVKDMVGPFAKAPYIGGVSKIGIMNVNQGVLRTEELCALGGFSLAFKDYGIDPDLTAKVLFSGKDVVLTKKISIHHNRVWETDTNTERGAELKTKHDRYFALYNIKYAKAAGFSPRWEVRKRLWKYIHKKLGTRFKINSVEPYLGQLHRDWYNIFSSRYIRVIDPILSRARDFHLRQYAPVLTLAKVPNDETALATYRKEAEKTTDHRTSAVFH